MPTSDPEITKRISAHMKVLRKDIAPTMQGFSAVTTGGGPSLMYVADAIMAFEQFSQTTPEMAD